MLQESVLVPPQAPASRKLIHTVIDMALNFIQLFLSMYLSELLTRTPVFGGALYVAGRYWVVYFSLYARKTLPLLPPSIRAKGIVLFVLSLLLNVLLVIVYPWAMTRANSYVLLFAILLIVFRQIVTDHLALSLRPKQLSTALLLLTVHVACILFGMLFFRSAGTGAELRTVFLCTALVGVLLYCKQLLFTPYARAELPTESATLESVKSYKIYNQMVINVLVALNLSITTYICYLRYLPYQGFFGSFAGLLIWLGYIFVITTAFVFVLLRISKFRYDKPTLFVLGAATWTLVTVFAYNGRLPLSGLNSYIAAALYGFGLACMLSIIIAMGNEMGSVIKIGLGEIDNRIYEFNTQVMVEWSLLISSLLLLGVFTISSFVLDGRIAELDNIVQIPELILLISFLLPMICVVVALVKMIVQPLDRQYVEKLRDYRRQQARGELNPALENKLKKVLVASTPKRIGIILVKKFVSLFIPLKIYGKENVATRDMPVVFVCNHYEIYGPVAAVARIPYYLRPWIISSMLDKTAITQALESGVETVFHFMPKGFCQWLCRFAAPIVYWIFQSLDPIPVYRDNPREVMRTFRLTVEALECNDNILLFPENPQKDGVDKYATDSVNAFYSGFSQIGTAYYQKTKRAVRFVPVYISKAKRTLTFGEGIRFNPDIPKAEEKDRIVSELRAQMLRFSQDQ